MLERSEGVGEMRENFLRRKCGVGVQQIVDEQDGGAVLSGKILPILTWEFCQQFNARCEERDNDNVPNAQFMYI